MDKENKIYTANVKNRFQIPEYQTLYQYIKRLDEIKNKEVYLRIKRDGVYKEWSFGDFKRDAFKCAKSLTKLGISNGCGININSYNNPEWMISYYGSFFAKYVPTGVYTTSSPSQCEYFYKTTDAEVIFVEDEERLKKYIEIKDNLTNCKAIILMESINGVSDELYVNLPIKVYKWDEFLELGQDISDETIENMASSIKADDTLTLIFTSGTSSLPKACMISHRNACTLSSNCVNQTVLDPNDVSIISYLPLSHIAEQMFTIFSSAMIGFPITFGDRDAVKGSLINTLLDVRPTYFMGVPRVYEKMQNKIQTEINQQIGVKKYLIDWAMKVGLENGKRIERGENLNWSFYFANSLVFKKILKNIGFDRVKICLCGAAPISKNTLEFFVSLNCRVRNCYGLSETTGPCSMEVPEPRLGSIGRMVDGQTKIAEDGEILLRGPFVFKGYYNNQEATNEVIDSDGWYHTGDIGYLDDDGYLFITDRKKDIIITAGGENIAPTMIEGKIRLIPGVEQAVVCGDKQKFLVCLITVNLQFLQFLKSKNAYNYKVPESLEEASNDEDLYKYIDENIKLINKQLAQVQTIKKFKILPNEFMDEGENSELTSTKKLKRKIVNQRYQNEIKQLYGDLYFEN